MSEKDIFKRKFANQESEPVGYQVWFCNDGGFVFAYSLDQAKSLSDAHGNGKITPVYSSPRFMERITDWDSIETAPKDGSEILIFGFGTYTVAYWNNECWRDIGDIGWGGFLEVEPTHWMPLPEPPKEEEGP